MLPRPTALPAAPIYVHPADSDNARNMSHGNLVYTDTYQEGDTVRITDGALESFLGTVEEIDLDRSKVRVVVSMFGRETPVELELDQVEPANE